MATPPTALEEKFALTSSRHFPDWLGRMGASLVFTTYQAGKVFFINSASSTGRRKSSSR